MRLLHMPVLAIMLLAASCANYTTPLVPPERLSPAQRSFETSWQASLEVLRQYNFQIDQEDRRSGTIVTLPLTGRQWFEPWRKDAATAYDVEEGSVQTIYRTVTIRVAPISPGADQFTPTVAVRTTRSEKGAPQLRNMYHIYNLFVVTGHRREKDVLLEQTTTDVPVVDLGRDNALEAKILRDINTQIAKNPV